MYECVDCGQKLQDGEMVQRQDVEPGDLDVCPHCGGTVFLEEFVKVLKG